MRYGPDGRPAKRPADQKQGGSNGSSGSAGAVAWSVPPAALALSGPYLVALSEGAAEARLLEPLNSADLWQRLALPLPGGATASNSQLVAAPSPAADGSLLIASLGSGAVAQLRPVSFVRQGAQLLALGEHEEALALAALAPAPEAQERRRLEDAVHLSYGQLLFRRARLACVGALLGF